MDYTVLVVKEGLGHCSRPEPQAERRSIDRLTGKIPLAPKPTQPDALASSSSLSMLPLRLQADSPSSHPKTKDPREEKRRLSSSLVLLTAHSAGSESSTRSTGGSTGPKDEGGDGSDGEPVGVPELGLETSVPDPVPDDDPEGEVDSEGDQRGEEGEEGGERHEDGAGPRGEGDSELQVVRTR